MGKEAMMLSKDYDKNKLVNGITYYVSEKYDGVPGVFHWSGDRFINLSRQHKEFVSGGHLIKAMKDHVPPGLKVVGEQWSPDMPFKDISGLVRKQTGDCSGMHLRIFDFDAPAKLEYGNRFNKCVSLLHSAIKDSPFLEYVKQYICHTHEDIMLVWQEVRAKNPRAEGLMIRPCTGPDSFYKYGRSWGMMRYVPKPTKDLKVISFEEAISKKTGEGLGMTGRLNCAFSDGSVTGVGPGKATHAQRRDWFNNPHKIVGHIVKVQFKEDAYYTALRQPTYQHHRPDKEYPDDA